MSYVITTLEGDRREYQNRIVNDADGYQWAFTLDRVNGQNVTNWGWRAVGPNFETRQACARYLGWIAGQSVSLPGTLEHRDELIAAYDALFCDVPVEVRNRV